MNFYLITASSVGYLGRYLDDITSRTNIIEGAAARNINIRGVKAAEEDMESLEDAWNGGCSDFSCVWYMCSCESVIGRLEVDEGFNVAVSDKEPRSC